VSVSVEIVGANEARVDVPLIVKALEIGIAIVVEGVERVERYAADRRNLCAVARTRDHDGGSLRDGLRARGRGHIRLAGADGHFRVAVAVDRHANRAAAAGTDGSARRVYLGMRVEAAEFTHVDRPLRELRDVVAGIELREAQLRVRRNAQGCRVVELDLRVGVVEGRDVVADGERRIERRCEHVARIGTGHVDLVREEAQARHARICGRRIRACRYGSTKDKSAAQNGNASAR
jgi:hypothetical protein